MFENEKKNCASIYLYSERIYCVLCEGGIVEKVE